MNASAAGAPSERSHDTVVVVAGGDPVTPGAIADLPSGALVIAADSGVERALGVGLHVDLAVGDFDSVSHAALQRIERDGARLERHPEAKDHTDLELALAAAVACNPRRVVVLGGHGGRLDHFLANALVLTSPRWAGVELVARMGGAVLTVVRDHAEVRGAPGDLVTLVPAHGAARGVTTEGLRYPLDDEDLDAGSTRGVSNELVRTSAVVHVRDGVLLVIQPGITRTEDLDHHPHRSDST